MKYIISKLNEVCIFSGSITHAEAARIFPDKPISAGFIKFGKGGKVSCFGESQTLGIGSRESDQEIIQRDLNTNY